jgi:hypothetical protein
MKEVDCHSSWHCYNYIRILHLRFESQQRGGEELAWSLQELRLASSFDWFSQTAFLTLVSSTLGGSYTSGYRVGAD